MSSDIIETVEGKTKIRVPNRSLTDKVPPMEPAFFNPKAKLNRDFSIIAYSAFWKKFDGPKIFLDGLTGIGARAIRVATEINNVEKVIVNDVNPNALDLARESFKINKLKNFEVSENEVCRFFSLHSKKNSRGSIVDVDPFGSPSKYIDCAIRATMHGGLMSVTATDLQVLHGLFNKAARRRYHGIPIKTKFSNEIAIRLVLGCVNVIANRLDITMTPLFVDNAMHYYRAYIKILTRPDQDEKLGYISYCKHCGARNVENMIVSQCDNCNDKLQVGGPLWIGKLFDKEFISMMKNEVKELQVDKKCEKILEKCIDEEGLPPTYYTLDEIASITKSAPFALDKAIKKLQNSGYNASKTSLNPTGFRTNAKINEICSILKN
ncbi:tRNA (guanine-N1)-methyltransferase [Candidatus Nitrosopelagicus sp.]|nr:tRNA (guanine-N1)-methyltransferase [Candidatus Nitrosopelagicus sp.]